MEVLCADSGYPPSAPPWLLPAAAPRDPGPVGEMGAWPGLPARWPAPRPADACLAPPPADCTGYLTSDCIRQLQDQAAVLLWAGGAFASLELDGACPPPCAGIPQHPKPRAAPHPGLAEPLGPPVYDPAAWASLPLDGSSDSSTGSSDFWTVEQVFKRCARPQTGGLRYPSPRASAGPAGAPDAEAEASRDSTHGPECPVEEDRSHDASHGLYCPARPCGALDPRSLPDPLTEEA